MAGKNKASSKAAKGARPPKPQRQPGGAAVDPSEAVLLEAFTAHQAQDLGRAAALYQSALQLNPRQLNAWRNLGVLLRKQGKHQESRQCAEQALRLAPQDATLLGNYGNVLRDLGELERSCQVLERAVALEPSNGGLRHSLAISCNGAKAFERSRQVLQPLLQGEATDAATWLELGNALNGLGQKAEALRCWQRGSAGSQGEQKLLNSLNLAQTLCEQKRFGDAQQLVEPLLQDFQDRANVHYALAVIQRGLGQLRQADQHFRDALQRQENYPICLNTYGLMLRDLGRVNAARQCFERALRHKPDFAEAMNNLGSVLKDVGEAEQGLGLLRQSAQLLPNNAVIGSNVLFTLCGYHLETAESRLEEAQAFAARLPRGPFERWKDRLPNPDPQRRLVVGLVSPDFCRHAVSYFIEPLLERWDRSALELIAYHCGEHFDDYSERLKGKVDRWRSIRDLPLEEQVQLVLRDEVDILVDLAGHTAGNALPLLAHKPAPIQASYLGYYATTGLEQVDYWVTDRVIHPDGNGDLCCEQQWRLPRCYVTYRPIPDAPPVQEPPCLRNGWVTFGSFNQSRKITLQTARHWMAVLEAVPESRLLLKSKNLGEAEERRRVEGLFAGLGLAAERLEIRGHSASLAEHMGSYGSVDLALDTWPYTGCTTTADALWMGVPVLTVAGPSMVTRQAASLVAALGEPGWICRDGAELAQRALELLADREDLRVRRLGQRPRMASGPLLDAAGLADALEGAFRQWWHRWLEQRGWPVGAEGAQAQGWRPTARPMAAQGGEHESLSHSPQWRLPLHCGALTTEERQAYLGRGEMLVPLQSLSPMGAAVELFRRRQRGEALVAQLEVGDAESWERQLAWWRAVYPQLLWERQGA